MHHMQYSRLSQHQMVFLLIFVTFKKISVFYFSLNVFTYVLLCRKEGNCDVTNRSL